MSDTAVLRYSPTVLWNSAWVWLLSITLWSGVTPSKAASNVARLTPLACASGQSPATKASKPSARAAQEKTMQAISMRRAPMRLGARRV